VEGTKSLDQDKIRVWLHANTVETVQGPFKVDANGLSQGFSQSLVQIQDGHLKLVTPENMAEAKMLVPYPGK
jgi:branched-chain amino acid transport system substrate-binding protein